jgi:SAM-dependent methyltransferase
MVVKRKDWYKHWFGNEYLTVYADRDLEEARTLVRLIESQIPMSPQHLILDLCCGQGRHANLLASKGYRAVGLDLSRTLLEVAGYRTGKAGNPRFVQADMRALPFSADFDILLNLFTSFGYFYSDQENQEVFNQFYRVLKPGGWFVFDYFNAAHLVRNLVVHETEEVNGSRMEFERWITDARVEKLITLKKNGNCATFFESVKIYQPEDIRKMMQMTDLNVERIFGDYNGSAFSTESPRLIITGKKGD